MPRPGRFLALAILATLLACAPGLAQSQSLQVGEAWARRAPGGHGATGNGAAYVQISNPGSQPDALVAASSDAAGRVELHETTSEGGVMKMTPREKFAIPAGGRLDMKPGGHHIMLMGLTRDLKAGDTIKLRLTFERAGEKDVNAQVR